MEEKLPSSNEKLNSKIKSQVFIRHKRNVPSYIKQTVHNRLKAANITDGNVYQKDARDMNIVKIRELGNKLQLTASQQEHLRFQKLQNTAENQYEQDTNNSKSRSGSMKYSIVNGKPPNNSSATIAKKLYRTFVSEKVNGFATSKEDECSVTKKPAMTVLQNVDEKKHATSCRNRLLAPNGMLNITCGASNPSLNEPDISTKRKSHSRKYRREIKNIPTEISEFVEPIHKEEAAVDTRQSMKSLKYEEESKPIPIEFEVIKTVIRPHNMSGVVDQRDRSIYFDNASFNNNCRYPNLSEKHRTKKEKTQEMSMKSVFDNAKCIKNVFEINKILRLTKNVKRTKKTKKNSKAKCRKPKPIEKAQSACGILQRIVSFSQSLCDSADGQNELTTENLNEPKRVLEVDKSRPYTVAETSRMNNEPSSSYQDFINELNQFYLTENILGDDEENRSTFLEVPKLAKISKSHKQNAFITAKKSNTSNKMPNTEDVFDSYYNALAEMDPLYLRKSVSANNIEQKIDNFLDILKQKKLKNTKQNIILKPKNIVLNNTNTVKTLLNFVSKSYGETEQDENKFLDVPKLLSGSNIAKKEIGSMNNQNRLTEISKTSSSSLDKDGFQSCTNIIEEYKQNELNATKNFNLGQLSRISQNNIPYIKIANQRFSNDISPVGDIILELNDNINKQKKMSSAHIALPKNKLYGSNITSPIIDSQPDNCTTKDSSTEVNQQQVNSDMSLSEKVKINLKSVAMQILIAAGILPERPQSANAVLLATSTHTDRKMSDKVKFSSFPTNVERNKFNKLANKSDTIFSEVHKLKDGMHTDTKSRKTLPDNISNKLPVIPEFLDSELDIYNTSRKCKSLSVISEFVDIEATKVESVKSVIQDKIVKYVNDCVENVDDKKLLDNFEDKITDLEKTVYGKYSIEEKSYIKRLLLVYANINKCYLKKYQKLYKV